MNEINKKQVSRKVIYLELSYLIIGILFEIKKELGEYAREKYLKPYYFIKSKINRRSVFGVILTGVKPQAKAVSTSLT